MSRESASSGCMSGHSGSILIAGGGTERAAQRKHADNAAEIGQQRKHKIAGQEGGGGPSSY